MWECQNDGGPQVVPRNARWAGKADLAALHLAEETREVIEEWFRDLANPPAGRPAWERQGWWQHPWQWIVQQMPPGSQAVVDRSSSGKMCSAWGHAVRVRTRTGSLFFKAVPTWSGHEPKLTQVLSQLFPEHLPKVVAFEEKWGWLLMEDFGPHLRGDGEDIGRLRKALRQLSELQVGTIGCLNEIAAAGCPDLRGNEMDELEALFEKAAGLLAGAADREVARAAGQCERALEAAKAVARRAGECGVPHALVHGDPTWINMAAPAGSARCIFFDWGESCISHPFMDGAKFARHSTEWSQIQEAYFEPWTVFCSRKQLSESFALCAHLERIHELRRYVQVYPLVEAWLGERALNWTAGLVNELQVTRA